MLYFYSFFSRSLYVMYSGMFISLPNSSLSPEDTTHNDLVSYAVREIAITINLVFLGEIISVVGLAGNIINIIVFINHGFTDTINISLVALSVADLGSLFFTQWFFICVNPWFVSADLPFLPLEIQSLTAGYPHVYFMRVTGFITAFVSFERCLCVLLPLKVKTVFTKRSVSWINVGIFFLTIPSLLPVYLTAYYDWKFDAKSNKTRLGILYTGNKDEVLGVSLMITNLGMPFLSFLIIIVSTTLTSILLRRSSKWRMSTSSSARASGDDISTKEKKIILTITTMSVMFIISQLPIACMLTARAVVPGLSITGRFANINYLVVSFAFLVETIHSSINIVVFYNMSSKYRQTVRVLFLLRGGKNSIRGSHLSKVEYN